MSLALESHKPYPLSDLLTANDNEEPHACLATHTPTSFPKKGALVEIAESAEKVRWIVVDTFTRVCQIDSSRLGVLYGLDVSTDFPLLLQEGHHFTGIPLLVNENALAKSLATTSIGTITVLVQDYFAHLHMAKTCLLPVDIPAPVITIVLSYMS